MRFTSLACLGPAREIHPRRAFLFVNMKSELLKVGRVYCGGNKQRKLLQIQGDHYDGFVAMYAQKQMSSPRLFRSENRRYKCRLETFARWATGEMPRRFIGE